MKGFTKLCTPAKIYFAIAVIAAIVALLNGAAFMYAFWQIVFALIWTYVLGWLCDKGYRSISWFLVLLPYILMALAMFDIYHVTDEQRQFMRAIGLQGAYGKEAMTNAEREEYQALDGKLDNRLVALKNAGYKSMADDIRKLMDKISSVNTNINNATIKGQFNELKNKVMLKPRMFLCG